MATTIYQKSFHKHILLDISYNVCEFHAENTFPYNGVTHFHQNSMSIAIHQGKVCDVINISMLVISKRQSATKECFTHKLLFFLRPIQNSHSLLCDFKGIFIKGELQRENKLISYERAFKMLENDMYIAGIGQAVLELLSFKVESGNHQRGITLLQKFSDIFGNMRLVLLKMTSHLTSHNFQILKIEIFSKLCKM